MTDAEIRAWFARLDACLERCETHLDRCEAALDAMDTRLAQGRQGVEDRRAELARPLEPLIAEEVAVPESEHWRTRGRTSDQLGEMAGLPDAWVVHLAMWLLIVLMTVYKFVV